MQETNMNRIPMRYLTLVVVACSVLVVGCGRAPNYASVRGVVEYDGQPLTEFDNAAVIFTPKGGRLATGTIGSDGTFQLSTLGIGDGAVVGPARVSVSATVDSDEPSLERHAGVRWVIPQEFADPDTSGLACEVEPGKENVFRIQLTSDGTASIERM